MPDQHRAARQRQVKVHQPWIAPSLLAADPLRIAEAVLALESTADELHVDVMDLHFAPNVFGSEHLVRHLVELLPAPVTCHLMIEDPDHWAPRFAEIGAQQVVVHAETTRDLVGTARSVRAAGARVGVALLFSTPVERYADVLAEFTSVLVLTVPFAGLGGQRRAPRAWERVAEVRRLVDGLGLELQVVTDGGVDAASIASFLAAGADGAVVGTDVFAHADPAARVRLLRKLGAEGLARRAATGATSVSD